MIETEFTREANVDYPIMQGGMLTLSTSELVSSVSEAGCLGILAACTFEGGGELREEIKEVRSKTDQPFGVNITLLPEPGEEENTEEYVKAVIEENVDIVETSGRPPNFINELHENGIKVIHKVPASPSKTPARFAKAAESFGADMVSIVGYEAGGHPGTANVTTLILLEQVAEKVDIPVLAGGGFATGKGLISALALGADGVVMGTRFALTEESPAHPDTKKVLVDSEAIDTVLVQESIQNPIRVLINEAAERTLGMEEMSYSLEELMEVISGERGRNSWIEGNINEGLISIGQSISQINEVKGVEEVVAEIIEEAKKTMGRLEKME